MTRCNSLRVGVASVEFSDRRLLRHNDRLRQRLRGTPSLAACCRELSCLRTDTFCRSLVCPGRPGLQPKSKRQIQKKVREPNRVSPPVGRWFLGRVSSWDSAWNAILRRYNVGTRGFPMVHGNLGRVSRITWRRATRSHRGVLRRVSRRDRASSGVWLCRLFRVCGDVGASL